MNGTGLAIAAAVLFILVMFWNSLKANMRPRSAQFEAPEPAGRAAMPAATYAAAPAPTRRETIDLRQFLCALQSSYEPTLERRGIRLDLCVPAMPLTVAVRKSDLHRLFAHFIRELCEASCWGVTLRILARSDGAQAVINCLDIGAPEPRLARAFSGISAAEAAKPPAMAARAIVSELGGRLYAAPSPLGQQSLTLRIPLLRLEPGLVGSP